MNFYSVGNYVAHVYRPLDGSTVIEIRPRNGSWTPMMVAVPIEERELLPPEPFRFGPPNHLPDGDAPLAAQDSGEINDGLYWYVSVRREATPEQSCYVTLADIPSEFLFGVLDADELYRFRPRNRSR